MFFSCENTGRENVMDFFLAFKNNFFFFFLKKPIYILTHNIFPTMGFIGMDFIYYL